MYLFFCFLAVCECFFFSCNMLFRPCLFLCLFVSLVLSFHFRYLLRLLSSLSYVLYLYMFSRARISRLARRRYIMRVAGSCVHYLINAILCAFLLQLFCCLLLLFFFITYVFICFRLAISRLNPVSSTKI